MLLLREAARPTRTPASGRGQRTSPTDLRPAGRRGSGYRHGRGPSVGGHRYETGARADIIDLSERVGDQLYDQYADAERRAVGD